MTAELDAEVEGNAQCAGQTKAGMLPTGVWAAGLGGGGGEAAQVGSPGPPHILQSARGRRGGPEGHSQICILERSVRLQSRKDRKGQPEASDG